ncbi:MAG: hypothetical protein KTR25_19950 [Myxococcales bacterium]|nr:hypothetical protein [Myxococcales bacterium]
MTTVPSVGQESLPIIGREPDSPIEPPPRARLEGVFEALMERRSLAVPSLPQGVPEPAGIGQRRPSLLMIGELLEPAASDKLCQRGFRKVVDVEDLVDALGALSERRYDAVALWDHVYSKPVRFVRALLGFDGPSPDPLLPLLAARVRNVPIAVIHGGGGYAVFQSGGRWCLSEVGGPDWVDALLAWIALKD